MSAQVYDIIFAGGGTAACLIAGRLSAANPNLKILILESGEHTKGKLEHIQPGCSLSHLAPLSTTVTCHVAKASDAVNGRKLVVSSGRCVGGGSSVNYTMYTRASASDYDDWETVFGNNGWSSKDLIPLLRKTEEYQVGRPEASAVHGYSGSLKVSMGGILTNVGKNFLEVAGQYDKYHGMTDDVNGLHYCNKYGLWPKWIDSKTGRRSDVPHHFIYNQSENRNLVIETAKKVHKIIFEGDVAVGVKYVNDLVLDPSAHQEFQTARASRLVVVSAGAFGSPAILERSGIGSPAILNTAGVEVKVDLPGVGAEYQDHNVLFVPYAATEDTDSFDGLVRGEFDEVNKWNKVWTETGQGPMASNGIDAGIKLRPTAQELDSMPAFSATWESRFANVPDKPVIFLGQVSLGLGAPPESLPPKCFSMAFYTMYPESRGSVHIASATNPHAPQVFDTGFLAKQSDVEVLIWGYKRSREFARRMWMYKGATLKPNFREDSRAAFSCHDDAPVDINASDIEYSSEDDQAIEDFIRANVATTWHSLGTCPMKPREQGGVVNSKLTVYGCQRLKVADLSIAPGNVGSNTYSTALVIAEKAATIIADELGLALA